MPYGTNTIFFIPKGKVPAGRKVTYGIIVAEIKPQKAETCRTILTVGGNLINFPGDIKTPTAYLITAKLIFNSLLSTKNAKFVCTDIAKFYLKNIMNRYYYMQMINLSYIWISLDTSQNPSPQVCGGNKLAPFNFYW